MKFTIKTDAARHVLLLCVLCAAMYGQTDGSILGIVKDSTGAVMPRATIGVTNLETGSKKTTESDSSGFFQVLALSRGFYSVSISAPGFAVWQLDRAELTVGEQKRLEPVLNAGDVKQQITVQAGVELVQTEKASVETGIEQKQIRDLPLNGRDPIQMVSLAPGMRYLGVGGNTLDHAVQGLGQHNDATQFSVDGVDSNDPSLEQGIAFPNLDSVAQFSIQTSNFSAENGRDPLQVIMVTKSGGNAFHGTLWEFLRNDALDARNTFAPNKPTLRRNQYGFSAGGPVIHNKTFFFTSFEGLRIRTQTIYNSPTISPAFLDGDVSSLPGVTDPLTGKPFAENRIPASRFSNASKFFFPHILLPNAAGNFYRALSSVPDNGTNFLLRIDHQISAYQRIYVRWIRVGDGQRNSGYKPSITTNQDLVQHNLGLHYDWNLNPTTLLTVSGGFLHSDSEIGSPLVGKENLTAAAGIQGFPTALRAQAIGLPSVTFTGYAGFSYPQQVPASFKREVLDAKASMSLVRGKHTIGIGAEYLDHRTLAHHSSAAPRGAFTFNGQYTGNSFIDYLLGMVQSANANVPLADFAMAHSPYSALYVEDTWRVLPSLTVDLGLRYDRWWEKALVRGAGSTFDVRIGKAIAGENAKGQVDLSAQPVAPFLAAATAGLWIPASQAGIPRGLFEAAGYLSPRLGAAWRPLGRDSLVVRGGYGIFVSSFNGNITGSQVIGPPYWASQTQTFSRASQQRWETAFPAEPSAFVAPSVSAAVYNIQPMKIHQWNVAIQQALPWLQAAITVSYAGNRGYDLTAWPHINTAPPGNYTNLQAATPYPKFGPINLYQSIGNDWYNSLQVKLERRFTRGLSYMASYAFARNIADLGADVTNQPTPYAPKNYDRGPSALERRHILNINGIYELPLGRRLPEVARAILGGWQVSGIYSFISGAPLTFVAPGATLGNGVNARPNLVGNPHVANPSAGLWFDPSAFQTPPRYQFGNTGVGILEGPGVIVLDSGLMKNFHFREDKYVQFRWEMFNALNRVNLGAPGTTLGQPNTGKILGAGDARQMQLGVKIVF